MKFKKKYLAILDIVITEIISQKLQISLIKEFVNKNKGDLVFYTTENHATFKNLSILKQKLKEDLKLNGLVFFSILQFFYGEKKNINLLRNILNKGIEVNFIRENLILKNIAQLNKKIIDIKFFPDTHNSLIKNLKSNFLNKTKK